MIIHNIMVSEFSRSRANIRFRYCWDSRFLFTLFVLTEFALVQLIS